LLRDAPDRNESMDLDSWPRRPRPETTGPHYEAEVSRLADLRTVRAQLRTWVPDTLEDSDADGAVLDDLLLAVEELASNGLRHGRAPVRVHAVRMAEGLLLDVSDGYPHRWPEPAVGRDPARGGMGLRMVAHLTIDRGWTVAGDRKHVWACFATD
jgi:anti-sigma regulatory factor (Ser/Thr protein kinase)